MKNIFTKKVDMKKWREYTKKHPGACLMSQYDLGYKGLFGIEWGWYKTRLGWWWLSMQMKYTWLWKLKWFLDKCRYYTYVTKDHDFMQFDRLTLRKKKLGVMFK